MRKDVLKRNVTAGPGPSAYATVQEFSRNQAPKFTFGKGNKKGNIYRTGTPGPGTYVSRAIVGSEGTRHSIYSRQRDTSPKYGEHSPGPCVYSTALKPQSPAFSIGREQCRVKEMSKTVNVPSASNYNPNVSVTHPTSPLWKMCAGKRIPMIAKSAGPDPGSYSLPSMLGGPKIMLHGKRAKEKMKEVPGPGAYNPNFKVVAEQYPGIVLSTGPRTEKDFSTKRCVPGPGKYSLNTTLNPSGIKFGSGKKCTHKVDRDIPGPGAYKIPCKFGNTQPYQIPGKNLSYSFV